jgi:GDP/UDP-N,N'-diacetylbacillosamine 2-epimerase (hydrolysing)
LQNRKILVITGIRSEYDILYPVLRSIKKHSALELQTIVTGTHCSNKFGKTEQLVIKDGFPIAERIESLLDSDTPGSRIKSAGIQITGLVQTIERIKPHIILVAGDREEAITGALCGAYMNIPVAHMCGGDYAEGNVDDSVRHAVTKLAHLHFPMSLKSKQRIIDQGEESWRIHCTGNPAIDRLLDTPKISKNKLSKKLKFDVTQKPLLLVIQHAITSEINKAYNQMSKTLEAVAALKYPAIISYPNSDAGSKHIINAIETYAPEIPNTLVYQNLPRQEFVNLLRTVDVLVGNSSLGILEAPALKLPAVNIGNRQKGREHTDNVLFVKHNVQDICSGINKALYDKTFRKKLENCENPFGDGQAGIKIADYLAKAKLDKHLLIKKWTFN